MPLESELKTMTIREIMDRYPQTEPVFQTFGLYHYAKTETAKYENLQASALVHAVNIDDLTHALAAAIES